MNPTKEDLLTYVNVFKEQLLTQRQQILKDIAKNPLVDPNARLEAHNQASDLAYTAFRLNVNTPAFIQRHATQGTLDNINKARAITLKDNVNTVELAKDPFLK